MNPFGWLKDKKRNEPVAVYAIARALVTLLAGYGLELDPEWIVGVYLVAEAVFTYFQRRNVSPVNPTDPAKADEPEAA